MKDRELLLILDNCEHLIDACAELAQQLLRAGARLKLLASSREYLHVAGEVTYPVPALAVPDARGAPDAEALSQYEAVRLFVDRARRSQPALRADGRRTRRSVVDICRRLDGIPLAIELAAARVRSLSVETIAERLTDRFRLLTRGDRTGLPRQQTLRALIDWSYDLLRCTGKGAVCAVSPCSPAASRSKPPRPWAPAAAIPGEDVLDLLAALVDKSLVELDAGGARYRMLETVRQYAQEKLDRVGRGGRCANAASRVLRRARNHARTTNSGATDQGKWLARLDLERENFLTSHAWCEHAPDGAAQDLRLADHLQLYWLPRGLIELGYRVTLETLARPGAQARDLPARRRALRGSTARVLHGGVRRLASAWRGSARDRDRDRQDRACRRRRT